jgi:large subunit ribosomal protein L13
MIVFDAEGAVAGRLASFAVKKALAGEEVVVVNCEKAVITGSPDSIISKYEARRGITQKANPEDAAKWPRRPDLLFKRIVQGMIPKKKARGAAAFKRIKAYVGVPTEFASVQKQKAGMRPVRSKSITLLKICAGLGWANKLLS